MQVFHVSVLSTLRYVLGGLALGLGLAGALDASPAQAAMPLQEAWTQKPVFSVLLGSQKAQAQLATQAAWPHAVQESIRTVVEEEQQMLQSLRLESDLIVQDPTLAPADVAQALDALQYNTRVEALAQASLQAFRQVIPGAEWAWFEGWAARAWEEAAARRPTVHEETRAGVTTLTYNVYATQYDAYTTNEVAVPDKYVKFASQGTQYSSAYPNTLDYRVTLVRGSYSYTVRVYEVGPWNIDDNYWNAANDPVRPRRLFKDLPQGMPEAQAAYYDNYNGGKDQSGRTVGNPAGVDLAVEVAPKLGLAYLENDWVDVTYLWESGASTPTTGNLVGYVREGDVSTGTGIAGATVALSSGALTSTDATGLYRFSGIATGTYTVTAAADCYITASTSRSVAANTDTWASIALSPDPTCTEPDPGGCRMEAALPVGAAPSVFPGVLSLCALAVIGFRRSRR